MHHVPRGDWSSIVSEARRVTGPGDFFVIYEDNPVNPMTPWAAWRSPLDRDAVLLRMRSTRTPLLDQVFEIVARRNFFFLLDRVWARGPERFLRWLPLGAQYVVCARRPVSGVSASVQDPA
jgi:hypothetical protein